MRRMKLSDFGSEMSIAALQSALTFSADTVKNPKMSTALRGLNIGLAVGKFAFEQMTHLRENRKYTIRISEMDPLYPRAQALLIDSLRVSDQKSVVVYTKSSRSGEMPNSSPRFAKEKSRADLLNIFFDGERTQTIKFGSGSVEISSGSDHVSEPQGTAQQKTSPTRFITISCATLKVREEVLSMLTDEARGHHKRRPYFYMAQKWGSFRRSSDVPIRPAESVVLIDGQKERILSSLHTFLAQEDKYVEMGIPWHTGLLLFGPPGSGKTSIATAIAHTLNLDIYYISLSSLEDDNALLELLSDVSPRSILLIEDIDVAHAATDRDDTERGVTLSGLLNGLDGIATPHGIVTIMTTNHFDKLDPALVRPGRVDLLEEIAYVNQKQVHDLCTQFLGYVPDGLPVITEDDMIVASEIVDVFKSHIEDLPSAGPVLVTTLAKKILKDPDNVERIKKSKKQARI